MARTLAPDRERASIAILSAIVVLIWPFPIGQMLPIVLGGLIGWRFLRAGDAPPALGFRVTIPRWVGVAAWVLFFGLLVGLPLLRQVSPSQPLAMFDSFYRVGSFVFGGGHVVLPLLYAEVVPNGWVSNEQFVAGYGAAQAVPGPLFTFAAYLGAVMQPEPNGLPGATLALVAIFLPAILLMVGTLPFWDIVRAVPGYQSALRGINAAVVGILLAALYNPVWTSAIIAPRDFALGLMAFGLLAFWKWPPWLVVALSALAGEGMARF